MAKVAITGERELMRALQRAPELALAAFAGVAVTEQEKTITAAKGQTPVEFGTLKGSGHVQPPKVHGSGVEVTAGFGGGAEKYALYVHENMNANHPVGNAKFLERPFLERVPVVTKALAQGVAKAWLALRS